MKKFKNIISLALVALCTGFVSLGAVASAADNSTTSGNGMQISPVRTDLTIEPGSTQSVLVTVKNITSGPADLQVLINDFTVTKGNETGQPDLILDSNQFAPSHSLKRFIAPVSNVSLAPGQTKDVKVNISVPANAAGGGYYGAVRFAPVAAGTGKNINLSASVGSLILVKVPGDIKEQLSVASFDVRSGKDASAASSFFVSNNSLSSVVRFQNTGNLQEQPFGKIVLKKGDKVLQSTEINNTTPRGNVLPDSIRRFDIPLNKVGWFGKYSVEGNFGYGANGQLISARTTFYVIPVLLIVISLAVIALILLAIFGLPRAIRAYNQRILRNARRR
ncbi:MAG: DUF916 domain-containing protein [Candidatus Saccharimonadales bacterium]